METREKMEFKDESIPDKHGWISGVEGKLLFWVPCIHRPGLCHPSTICVMGGNQPLWISHTLSIAEIGWHVILMPDICFVERG